MSLAMDIDLYKSKALGKLADMGLYNTVALGSTSGHQKLCGHRTQGPESKSVKMSIVNKSGHRPL